MHEQGIEEGNVLGRQVEKLRNDLQIADYILKVAKRKIEEEEKKKVGKLQNLNVLSKNAIWTNLPILLTFANKRMKHYRKI